MAPATQANDDNTTKPPPSKRSKSSPTHNQDARRLCARLLTNGLPDQLKPPSPCIRNNLGPLRQMFHTAGFRTTIVHSPREALSIYRESALLLEETTNSRNSKEYLVVMLGLHPCQMEMEGAYREQFQEPYCLYRFCQRLRSTCVQSVQSNATFANSLETTERSCLEYLQAQCKNETRTTTPSSSSGSFLPQDLMEITLHANHGLRREQLQHEYDRIVQHHSSLSNALLLRWVQCHNLVIRNVYFKRSPQPQYERMSIFLYDPQLDETKPPTFTFVPRLHQAISQGPQASAYSMVQCFWQKLLQRGYYASETLRNQLEPDLKRYFCSGLASNTNIPLLLDAHFSPSVPLAFYFHGKAGAGKSSLVRNFAPALNDCIEEFADPEVMVRFVKQNLNKPYHTLELELELRPNNNDFSIMSIIQSRRMTMGQTKPGLVVVGLEEMASHGAEHDPNQLQICRLLSQRFAGRKGTFQEGASVPRNGAKRGISGDASVIPIFTSNYTLEGPCLEALAKLEMFGDLRVIEVTAVEAHDRVNFANQYFSHCLGELLGRTWDLPSIDLSIAMGSGDTRPLVRHLRMLAFYASNLVRNETEPTGTISILQCRENSTCCVKANRHAIDLRVGTPPMNNLYPTKHQVFDRRAEDIVQRIQNNRSDTDLDVTELSVILSFWLAKTLAPTVIVSTNSSKIRAIVSAVKSITGIHVIDNVDANEYKMMKSLYDPSDTKNLRDDILALGRDAMVAVELLCDCVDAQLCIREMIEDTPSMTAFSSEKSALQKDGLLFLVSINNDAPTPEIRSRASLML